MIGQGANGFVCNKPYVTEDLDFALSHPTDTRIFAIAAAFESGYTVDRIHALTHIDRWFLDKLAHIESTYRALEACASLDEVPYDLLRQAKVEGFSDIQIGRVFHIGEEAVRARRVDLGIRPAVKQIDTLAAEFPAVTNYLYLTYQGTCDDVPPEDPGRSVIVLGSGAYRIGSSVEFDWCAVNTVRTLRENGRRAIMINYNPETVSTDYDTCDRLYFDELSLETVWEICRREQPEGVVVSVGGQIPNNLALPLSACGIRILGTSAVDIDRAEDRRKFSEVVDRLGIDQPRWKEMTTLSDIHRFIGEVGFPVLVRPSYVLSGAAMQVCYNSDDLASCLERAAEVSEAHPVVVSAFMQRCKELECDAVADNGKVLACAISEHIEFAGVHSGDATIQFPGQRIYGSVLSRIRRTAAAIAEELHITGPFNIQFLSSDLDLKVIECNLRASRSFPFVSKVWRVNLIELATRSMLGLHPAPVQGNPFDLGYVGVKCSQFSFARLHQADPVSGVDMASTGEVGCLGRDADEALLKAMLSVGHHVPAGPILLSTGDPFQKADMLPACRLLAQKGFTLYATGGTCRYLQANGVPALPVRWPDQPDDGTPSAEDLIREHKVDLVVNNPKNFSRTELGNGYHLRRAAVDFNVPLITDARLAAAYIRAFCTIPEDSLGIF